MPDTQHDDGRQRDENATGRGRPRDQAGRDVTLAPGFHMMLVTLRHRLEAGQTLKANAKSDKAGTIPMWILFMASGWSALERLVGGGSIDARPRWHDADGKALRSFHLPCPLLAQSGHRLSLGNVRLRVQSGHQSGSGIEPPRPRRSGVSVWPCCAWRWSRLWTAINAADIRAELLSSREAASK